MAALGVAILLAMRQIAPSQSTAAPKDNAPALPHSLLKFAIYDMGRRPAAGDTILGELEKLQVDYLLMQGVAFDQVDAVAQMVGMQQFYHYQASVNLGGPDVKWGNCILSRHPLLEVSPLMTFGIWARSEVDGVSFQVASMNLSPAEEGQGEFGELEMNWLINGSPISHRPIVIGSRFSEVKGVDYLVDRSTGWYDGLTAFAFITPTTRPATAAWTRQRLLFSTGWSCTAGQRIAGSTQDAWVVTASGQSPATTRPTTREAED